MTALTKAKPEYQCHVNENIYRATKGPHETCYHCEGECPRIVQCKCCQESFSPNQVRRVWVHGMNPANVNNDKFKRHTKWCADCIDKTNEVRLKEMKRVNERAADRSNNSHGERWEVRTLKVPYRADENYGPTFGHQVLIEDRVELLIDGEVESTHITRMANAYQTVRKWTQAALGWENINALLRQRS